MIMTIFHTVIYFLWIVILAAFAVISVSIACVVVEVIFFDTKNHKDSNK